MWAKDLGDTGRASANALRLAGMCLLCFMKGMEVRGTGVEAVKEPSRKK